MTSKFCWWSICKVNHFLQKCKDSWIGCDQEKKNIDHKAGSAVRTMLSAKTFRSERTRAKHGDKR